MTIYQAIVLIMIVLCWVTSTHKVWTTDGTVGVNFTVQLIVTAWWGGLIALLHAGGFW